MKIKILLLFFIIPILIPLNIKADMFPITKPKILNKKTIFLGYYGTYQDFCDGKYVWRFFAGTGKGSFVQVFENSIIILNGHKIIISHVKECSK